MRAVLQEISESETRWEAGREGIAAPEAVRRRMADNTEVLGVDALLNEFP